MALDNRPCGFAVKLLYCILYFTIIFVIYANAADNWDKDDDPIPMSDVKAVLGSAAKLPCDIEPSTRGDGVYMVLWFRNNSVKPIYSVDVRGRPFNQALNWSDEEVRPRARFITIDRPAALVLEGIRLVDEGIYRCRVDFKKSPTRNFQVNLTVIYPPHQLLLIDNFGNEVEGSVGPHKVGDEFGLSCEVRGGKPSPVIKWFINGTETIGNIVQIGENTVVSKIGVSLLQRENFNITYKCRAFNTDLVKPLEKSVTINMYLKPISVTIISKPTILEFGKSYELVCEVVGSYPRALVTWTMKKDTNFTKIHETGNSKIVLSTLLYSPMPEDNNKQLRCQGMNPMLPTGSLEDSFQLNIYFPPKVSLEIGNTLNAQNIKEEDDVYFECKILANPVHHKITWKHNGRILTQKSGIVLSAQNLVLQKINRENGGNYSCLASNSRGETASSIVPLRVQFAPVCMTSDVTIIGASLDESVKIRCQVEADPIEVEFTWEFNNSGENFELAPAKFDGNNGTTSEFIYTPLSERDYGALTCWGRNIIGKQKNPCVYQIIPAVKPSPLSNCTLKATVNKSSELLEIECISGYDGGLRQDFRLEAYEARTNTLRVNTSSVSVNNPVFKIPINDLLPATNLYLIAYALNAKGKSEVSLLENIILQDSGKQADTEVSVLPLLLLLIGAFIALGIIILSIMLILYRRRGTTSPIHIEPYMKQPIISPPDSRNNSMLDVTHGDHTYFVEYTLKQVGDFGLNQPDIIQSPQDHEKVKREQQLFLPVRPDTLFAPYDLHKQGLQKNNCSLNPLSTKSWEPISFKTDRNLMKEIIIANSIPGPESCV
ncbi:hypothetical protein HCN44_000576 [Aphidius gifuensis]|uniref:Ig-like domain-containing protein n=1 Tax=Aphidius gifuensis TaxID=684658 RepID=A0A834XR84_APHGI|nr:nephrin-like [Aphidius gifuensis]KAF7990771.1 hypothetical protein HCN44_000576 [Aphidius gifuensis]